MTWAAIYSVSFGVGLFCGYIGRRLTADVLVPPPRLRLRVEVNELEELFTFSTVTTTTYEPSRDADRFRALLTPSEN